MEVGGLVVGGVHEQVVEKPKKQRKWRPTIMFDVTRVRSEGERKLLEYNERWRTHWRKWGKEKLFYWIVCTLPHHH